MGRNSEGAALADFLPFRPTLPIEHELPQIKGKLPRIDTIPLYRASSSVAEDVRRAASHFRGSSPQTSPTPQHLPKDEPLKSSSASAVKARKPLKRGVIRTLRRAFRQKSERPDLRIFRKVWNWMYRNDRRMKNMVRVRPSKDRKSTR